MAQVYLDEEGLHDLYLYEDVSDPKSIKDLDTEEAYLVFKSKGEEMAIELGDIEWYRIVPPDSHMANYVRNNDHYGCAWDENGEVIKNG
ncbi:hypothetical protein [Enterococcus devriesei]|uniref:hypothetical protein n=1 Tax=Enterococcus devriesei TaxID=319970 RepID=UPI0036D36BA2